MKFLVLFVLFILASLYVYLLSFGAEWVRTLDAWVAYDLGIIHSSLMISGAVWFNHLLQTKSLKG